MIKLLANFYTIVLGILALYALHITILIVLYLRHKREPIPPLPSLPESAMPSVTVQVPLRNEQYVVKRVIQAIAALEWPQEKLEIQILDDSSDETTALAKLEAAKLQTQGLDIKVLHRTKPQGHKAGALAKGLQKTKGEFIAIFDADFCPAPDFLKRTVPHLAANPQLGMVQARWGHLNARASAITQAQALLLDAHFTVEHIARNRSNLLMNFNGTAGVWRRKAIETSGGWQSDTVAEDLDLSYRAQLQGWKILYLPNVVANAELPPLITAFKQQQYRWAKGAAQVFRKLIKPILTSPKLNVAQKLMASLHLSAYITQPLFLLMLILTLPVILYSPSLPNLAAILGTLLMIPPLLYILGQVELYNDWPKRILSYPVVMLLGMGISWNNTLALIDGLTHWGGPFVRTPKVPAHVKKSERQPHTIKWDRKILGDLCLGIYASVAFWQALNIGAENLMPLTAIYAGGEALVLWTTLAQANLPQYPK